MVTGVAIHEVYVVYPTDEDGRALLDKPVGHYSEEEVADMIAEGKGAWVTKGSVIRKHAIEVVHDSKPSVFFILESRDPIDLNGNKDEELAKLKQSAAEKLSPAEKKALGL